MYWWNKISAWWNRSVVIKIADPNYDVVLIRIDAANGTQPQELYLNRNNIFAMAWTCFKLLADGATIITEATITYPLEKDETKPQVRILTIPKWAYKSFIKQLACVVIDDLHWDGHCPKPELHTAYR